MPDYSVKVTNVSKIFQAGDTQVRAVDGVSFALKKGEFDAIVGPSGSGKSTLMNMLGTIDRPTKGEIYIDGIATSEMKGDMLAEFRNRQLGFVFQAFNLINGLDAEKNVELPLMVIGVPSEERKRRADALLTQLGLGHRLHLTPNKLSGGEQQRVAIARALVNNPSLLLADEPTGNLDTKSGDEVVRLFRKICNERKVTVVMITHNPDITRTCDRVIYIKDGKMEKEEVVK
ncbi:MAG: ABC transporter ATP-binding protein [Candidatus Micrarchaeota archaeon]|nr:ABC transporter ATP-binding protein [Candidatus Micrarchaeota archaeon]